MSSVPKTFTLYNGVTIPTVGYGTWKITDPQEGIRAMREAIEVGYTHIDSASGYGNEGMLGEAIRQSGVDRKNLFITTKLLNDDKGYDSTLAAFEKSLKLLGTDYVDLYLIHWPRTKNTGDTYRELNRQTWRAFERIYQEGRARAIGVSNFHKAFLEEFLGDSIQVKPMVNQIECHPFFYETGTIDLCKRENILVEAYSPLMRGGLLTETPLFAQLGEKYGKTPAQVVLRWILQHGVVPLPKTVTKSRMISNLDVYGFELSPEDMAALDALNRPDGKIGSYPENTRF